MHGLSEALRFCPICDGYESIDRRVGVLGDVTDGGTKALFLRTYTRDVSLFLTEEGTSDPVVQKKLDEEKVRIVRNVKQITLASGGMVPGSKPSCKYPTATGTRIPL
jgi:thioredoxin reductase